MLIVVVFACPLDVRGEACSNVCFIYFFYLHHILHAVCGAICDFPSISFPSFTRLLRLCTPLDQHQPAFLTFIHILPPPPWSCASLLAATVPAPMCTATPVLLSGQVGVSGISCLMLQRKPVQSTSSRLGPEFEPTHMLSDGRIAVHWWRPTVNQPQLMISHCLHNAITHHLTAC